MPVQKEQKSMKREKIDWGMVMRVKRDLFSMNGPKPNFT